MINNRDYFRLRKLINATWSIEEQRIEGKANIFNISLSGMLVETDKLFNPEHGMFICFKAEEIPALPLKGKLVWFNKVGEGHSHFLCGIKILKDSTLNQKWIKWMDDNILKLADIGDNKILNRYLISEEHE